MKKIIKRKTVISSKHLLHQKKDLHLKDKQGNILCQNQKNQRHSPFHPKFNFTHPQQYTRKRQKVNNFFFHKTQVCFQIKRTSYTSYKYCSLIMIFLFLNLLRKGSADWLMDCGDCSCKWNSGKKTATCNNLSLLSVPENLSPEVQVLDLSFNKISYLEQNAFLNARLQNLQKLYIRNSSMHQIDPRCFTQLEILIEIDLSNNLLRSLKPNLFSRASKLRYLILNSNFLEFLGDGIFQNLNYLHKIELKNNNLRHISSKAFVELPLLSHIYLDGNRLNTLRKEVFENLGRLSALSLDGNPWNCTCELQIFRNYVIKNNLYTAPTSCFYPKNLRGMLWVEDQPGGFACKPKIIYPAKAATITSSKENVTFTCRILSSPSTHVTWDFNSKTIRANTVNDERVQIRIVKDENAKEKDFGRELFISHLTIFKANQNDEGIYSCLAENAAGKDSVEITLVVRNSGKANDLKLAENLFFLTGLVAVCLVGVSLFMAMIAFCIYKSFVANHLRINSAGGGPPVNASQESTPNVDSSHTQDFGAKEVSLCVNLDSNQKSMMGPDQLQQNNNPQQLDQSQKHQQRKQKQQEYSMIGLILPITKKDSYMEKSGEINEKSDVFQPCEVSTEHRRNHTDILSFEGDNKGALQFSIAHERIKQQRTIEFQPDLLPSEKSCIRQDVSTSEKPNDKGFKQSSQNIPSRNKYNAKVQEYLLGKYGTVKEKTMQNYLNSKIISDHVGKKENPCLPLTSSSSLVAKDCKNKRSDFGIDAPKLPNKNNCFTNERHTKSLDSCRPKKRKFVTANTIPTSSTKASMPPVSSIPYAYCQPPPPLKNGNFSTKEADIKERIFALPNDGRPFLSHEIISDSQNINTTS